VYCEKPLTHNIHEAVEVIRAVDANQRVLVITSPDRQAAAQLLIGTGPERVKENWFGRAEDLRDAILALIKA
jgi:hypothetical protein